jgi:hypothetical protein
MFWTVISTDSTKCGCHMKISEIVVPESALQGVRPSDITIAVVVFVQDLVGECAYEFEELPINAQLAFGVNRYVAQTANGGHTQFYNNTGRQSAFLQMVRSGLEACGARPYVQIFAEFCGLVDSKDVVIPTDPLAPTHPEIERLDKRFYSLDPYETLMGAVSAWVRELPEFRSVPHSHYQEVIARLCEANTEREARLAARKRAEIEYLLTDPLRVAAGLLLAQSKGELRSITTGQYAAIAPDGREGIAWTIFARDGQRFHVFVFDDVAFLCDKEELSADALQAAFREHEKRQPAAPPTVPDEAHMEWVREKRRYRDFVSERKRSGYREIARVSGKAIADAIELNKATLS